MSGIVEVIVFAESETAIDHNVSVGIEWVWVDHDWDKLIGRINPVVGSDLLAVPSNGEFGLDSIHQTVALWISPEDEIVMLNIFVGDLIVEFDPRDSSKVTPPMGDRVLLFFAAPGCNRIVERSASWKHHQEAVHECVVYRAL